MKDLKIINKELNKEFEKIRKSNSDDYSIIVKQQEMLVDYYEKNKDQIKIDDLLEKYKKLTYDFPNIKTLFISFLVSFITSFAWSTLETVADPEKTTSKILTVVAFILLILSIIFLIWFIKKIWDSVNLTVDYYLVPFHAKVIQNILEEKGFYVDNEKQYEKIKEAYKGK